jgi:hypothetical protein
MNDFLNKEKNKMIKDSGFEVKKEIFIEIKNKIDNELSMLKKKLTSKGKVFNL